MTDKMSNSEIVARLEMFKRSDRFKACAWARDDYLIGQAITALSGDKDGDTKRLDFLDTLRGDMITGTSDDQELVGHDWVIYGQHYTIRDCIDAAMFAKEPGA